MIKIFTVVGARPQFIKAAVLSRLIKDEYNTQVEEILVHTGQHYDLNMSDIFFNEMNIPQPDYFLEVNEKTHGAMTGKMLERLEELMILTKPDIVLVYGDTNSTLAGALAGSKLHIPIAHVEAGLRSFWKKMPEEQNRILTDHISDFLFCPTNTAMNNLRNEGISNGALNCGDIMLDSFNYYKQKLPDKKLFYYIAGTETTFNLETITKFTLLTLHRAENTTLKETIENIFLNLDGLDTQIIFPIHPRTKSFIKKCNIKIPASIICLEPVGYFEMLNLLNLSERVITDSGGLQKEAFFAKKQCFTLRNQTEWVETLINNWNILLNPETSFCDTIIRSSLPGSYFEYFGSGSTGKNIITTLINYNN